MELPLYTSAQC